MGPARWNGTWKTAPSRSGLGRDRRGWNAGRFGGRGERWAGSVDGQLGRPLPRGRGSEETGEGGTQGGSEGAESDGPARWMDNLEERSLAGRGSEETGEGGTQRGSAGGGERWGCSVEWAAWKTAPLRSRKRANPSFRTDTLDPRRETSRRKNSEILSCFVRRSKP